MKPTRRPEVFDAYWRFAAERHQVFLHRARGDAGPWTEDPILRRYKFCNTFRAADRVSQYLIRDVIYAPGADDLDAEDAFLRIVLFRLFSKERTWQALEVATGGVRRSTLDERALGDVLEHLKRQQSIYTAAFILAAPTVFGHQAKHRNHLALVASMFRSGGLGRDLAGAKSLQDVYDALIDYPAIGPFLAYQIAVDLNYSEHLNFSENDFTMPGPGAVRGLQKVFADPGSRSPRELIFEMVATQQEHFDRLGLSFPGLFGRPLHAIDCQGLFCETDKYSRQAFPELKSNRVRIKQEFRQSPDPLPLFFPPKWQLNDLLRATQDREPTSGADAEVSFQDSRLRLVHGEDHLARGADGQTDDQLDLAL